PDGPGSHIPEIDELAAQVARRVAPAPGDRADTARSRPASGVGYDGDVVAVGQKRGMRKLGGRRPEAAYGVDSNRRGDAGSFERPRCGDWRTPRHAFLQ